MRDGAESETFNRIPSFIVMDDMENHRYVKQPRERIMNR